MDEKDKMLSDKHNMIDSEINTWNMCPLALESAIKDRISKGKKPKAIILVQSCRKWNKSKKGAQ